MGGAAPSPAIGADGTVYMGCSNGKVYALDGATGKKVWEYVAGAPLSASPAAAAGALVIGSQDGVLFCFGP